MTGEEIKKALECCIKAKTSADCEALKCPFYDNEIDMCMYVDNEEAIYANALDLINRQQAEIEEKQKLIDRLHEVNEQLYEEMTERRKEEVRIAKKYSIIMFAERLEETICKIPQHHFTLAGVIWLIKKLVKEMAGEE